MVDLQPHGKQYRGGATEWCGPAGKAVMPTVTGAVLKNAEAHSCCILLEGVWAAGTNAWNMGGAHSLVGGTGMEDCKPLTVSPALIGVCEGP